MTATDSWGIDELDGQTHTLVTREISGWEVMIGGGPEQFIVTATRDSGQRIANALTSTEPDDDDDTVDLTVGGQAVDYPAEYVLTRDEVLSAIAELESGVFTEGRWEQIG
ncbi:hypothetical protein JOD62_001378 [Microbacterium keratanolyticum]|uniref:Uncharacterized protein n=1 Tax=Microbacterium keratanolyticum TaxID=67574 RepID=A0A9W6M7X6_9MICO|nr:hypothetical protein [Microbacterium keratanolyticum]MBM7468830.1 hypothetical protein [Microbacterium keratanolyticum]GLK00907.1 hypothetical protein GCM10017596_06220 [Microbacterium keratanolyticum]